MGLAFSRLSKVSQTMTEATEPDPKLLEALICPLTKTSLQYDAENQELISKVAKLAYPIRGGLPVMIASEAREIESD